MRKIPNNGNLKMTKVAYPLGLFVCLFIYIVYIKWHWASVTQAFFSITEVATGARRGQQTRDPLETVAHGHKVFYGIMFDAGSTGTRVHIFQFTWQPGGILPKAESPGSALSVSHSRALGITSPCISAWITVNFLTGSLKTAGSSSVGMLDLGGGSTQITFLPRVQGSSQHALGHLLTQGFLFHSYLGLGLMSARLAILGGVEGKPVNLHQLCASRVSEILQSKVHRTEEVKDVDFYAFSYYYDLAANVGLIVCRMAETQPQSNPFMCMDLTYISLLLQEFGFPRNKVLK
ncbi:PREDICTED: ectonucleoside triphosphate diphosphohydrolase 6, partial [Hipposideros armiger]|uniref:Ectonucleoside triphosphate diphosphohydrolase 6 n=1 Tax=Hipposideros armiger TaxID=186990 RepID=A0A8B7QPB4_HIPAR